MFECCKSENEQHREAALEIFSNLPTMFGDSLSRYISVLKEIFQKSLVDPSPKVFFFFFSFFHFFFKLI